MKSKIRVSNSKTGLERTDGAGDVAPPSLIAVVTDDVVDVVVVDASGVDAETEDVPLLEGEEDDEALRSSALSKRFSVFLTGGAGPAGEAEPDWFVEKATLLKMAPRVLSMELGLSPREKTGRSSKDKP